MGVARYDLFPICSPRRRVDIHVMKTVTSSDASPVGLIGSERAGVYCLTQANGHEVWYARGDDGCIIKTFDVGPGDDPWQAIVALHALVYRDDDVESWARRVIGIGPVSSSSSAPPKSVRPARARTSEGARLALVTS